MAYHQKRNANADSSWEQWKCTCGASTYMWGNQKKKRRNCGVQRSWMDQNTQNGQQHALGASSMSVSSRIDDITSKLKAAVEKNDDMDVTVN